MSPYLGLDNKENTDPTSARGVRRPLMVSRTQPVSHFQMTEFGTFVKVSEGETSSRTVCPFTDYYLRPNTDP